MPKQQSTTDRLRRITASELAGFPKRRVLVVDDNRDTVDSEALLLTTLGQTVRRAYDGPSAVRMAQEFEPDVVLMDLDMPGMSGFDVARHLSACAWMQKARLVAYTGFARPEYRAAAEAAGFDDFILKPATLAQLISILNDAGSFEASSAGSAAIAPETDRPEEK